VRDTLALIEHQLTKAAVSVDFSPQEEPLVIRGSGGKIQQVLLNLFLNARDAMEAAGDGDRVLRIVSLATDGGAARLTVEDTGKGIALENLPRIFDPFFTTKGVRRGTGLGLAVSYGIVREHGGTIEVDSRPGRGARFTLEFPLLERREAAAPGPLKIVHA
jgi:hypothetical protein